MHRQVSKLVLASTLAAVLLGSICSAIAVAGTDAARHTATDRSMKIRSTTRGGSSTGDLQAIKDLYGRYSRYVKARNLDGIMSLYAPGSTLVAFDAFGPPAQDRGNVAYSSSYHYAKYFALFPGPIDEHITRLQIAAAGTLAYAYGFDRWSAVPKGSNHRLTQVYRFTDVLTKTGGEWLIVHEHVSFPVDPRTGKADWLSR